MVSDVLTGKRFQRHAYFSKKQHVFHLPSFLYARNYPAFVTPERNVLLVNVPVPGFQLLYEPAFGYGLAA